MTALPPRPQLVTTIREQCRVCYTCVRECPAKAIRISSGQAEVIPERCIGCGNCVKVCSQGAKQILDSTAEVKRLLASGDRVAACLAPSFPAEFEELDYRALVGMMRALGFDLVTEVGFGADLAADRYLRLLEARQDDHFIAVNCPAIVEFVERYHPELVKNLTPIVSPMIALARALHELHGPGLKIVFIGPCIAKKAERDPDREQAEVDAVLTFVELRALLETAGVKEAAVALSDFDPPHAGTGALFPISRGMLQAAQISEDLMVGEVVAADGRLEFIEAIKEFESGDLDARLLEALCCPGCIMGPGLSNRLPLFSRRSLVSKYARQRAEQCDPEEWREWMERFSELDLSRRFYENDLRRLVPPEEEIKKILERMGKRQVKDELNCGACGYDSCREHAIAIHLGLAEVEMCLPHTIEHLRKTLLELADSHQELHSVQQALIQSEKLASMGQLAAAVAHEVNNPLGVVLMFAHLLLDQVEQESRLGQDLKMIVEQTDRCKKIVAGLLNFARQNKVVRQTINLGELLERSMKMAPPPERVSVLIERGLENETVELDPDQITQVLVNLLVNAYDAMPEGGEITLRTGERDGMVQISIADTGLGIPPDNLKKIFEPFFTTKPLGKGAGLGLAVSYGIVKMHHGDIQVNSNHDPQKGPTGTDFTIALPRAGPGD